MEISPMSVVMEMAEAAMACATASRMLDSWVPYEVKASSWEVMEV